MRVLIIGGAGYIGSHAAKLLAKSGHEVVVLDDLSTGHEQSVRFGAFVRASYADSASVEAALRQYRIDTVMHFGAKSLVGESVENPLLYYAANLGGTVSLLQAMVRAEVKNFIFSSTAATFGEPSEVPINEDVRQLPVNPYGWSKLFVERVLRDAYARHGIRSATLRYFNAAGADPEGELGEDHNPETHLIPIALQVLAGKRRKLTVYGNDYPTKDGTCVRDYIHVNDLATAHLQALDYVVRENACEQFNLGTAHGYSVLEIIEAIRRVTGKELPYEVGPRRAGDPAVLVADASKARRLLGWKPAFDLDSIVRTAYQWTQKHPDGYAKR